MNLPRAVVVLLLCAAAPAITQPPPATVTVPKSGVGLDLAGALRQADARLAALDAKLTRVEAKLDRLLKAVEDDDPPAKAADKADPLLALREAASSCFGCHNPDAAKGGKVIFTADGRFADMTDRLLRAAIGEVEAGTMPPKDSAPLTAAQKDALAAQLKARLAAKK